MNQGFICLSCGHITARLPNMRRHVEGKHLNNMYHCSICGKTSNTKYNLYRHWSTVHQKELKEQGKRPDMFSEKNKEYL